MVFDIDNKHESKTIKNRTPLFNEQQKFKISSNDGCKILEWSRMKPLVNNVSNSKNESTIETLKVLGKEVSN